MLIHALQVGNVKVRTARIACADCSLSRAGPDAQPNLGTYVVGSNPMGVAFDGANILVTNSGSGTVSRL